MVPATEVETRLNAGTAVKITSTGSDDLTISSPVSWTTNTGLTLSSGRNVFVNADITASGSTAGLTIIPDSGSTGTGSYTLGNGVTITLSGATPGLSLAGTAYTVINSVTALQNMQNNLAGNYALGSDIDASATSTWNSGAGFAPVGPVGPYDVRFTGRFDGQGHTITGLFINRPDSTFVGLFGGTNGAVIRNVGLIGVNIAAANYTGSLVGNTYATSVIRTYATGTVTAGYSVGGLIGVNSPGSVVSLSYNAASVSGGGGSGIGGLAGVNYASISTSYNSGPVAISGTYYGGGLAGLNYGTIDSCFNSGTVTSIYYFGGLAARNESGAVVTNSYWDQTKAYYGVFVNNGTVSETGLSTNNTELQASFPSLDFSETWRIYDGQTTPLLKAFLKPVTVTANNALMHADGVTAWTGGNGVVWSDPSVVSSLSGTLTYAARPRARSDAGTYTITPGGYWSDQQGYDITAVDGVLTIVNPTVTPLAGPGGSISPSTPQTVAAGSTISFTVTPDPGYLPGDRFGMQRVADRSEHLHDRTRDRRLHGVRLFFECSCSTARAVPRTA